MADKSDKALTKFVLDIETKNIRDSGSTLIIDSLLKKYPYNYNLLQEKAKIEHKISKKVKFLKPFCINFCDIDDYMREKKVRLKKQLHERINKEYDERDEPTNKLKIYIMHEAIVSNIYGVHGKCGLPFWGSVVTRGNKKNGITYPRGYPINIAPTNYLETHLKQAFYISYLQMWNFGHFLTETASALYPILGKKKTEPSLKNIPILINGSTFIQNFQIEKLINFLNISKDQIFVIDDNSPSIQVETLFMSTPTHINRSFVSTQHSKIVKKLVKKLIKTNSADFQYSHDSGVKQEHYAGKLYISRSKLSSNQRKLHKEDLLEKHLQALGWEIYHPQLHSLQSQISTYEASTFICGSEGSAFHLLYAINTINIKRVILLSKKIRNNFTLQFKAQKINFKAINCLIIDDESSKEATNRDVGITNNLSIKQLSLMINRCTF